MRKKGKIYAFAVSAALCFAIIVPGTDAAFRDTSGLVPLGSAAGISLSTEGVLIVGLSGVKVNGETVYPAKNAGLAEGDTIIMIESQKISTAADLQKALEDAAGSVSITIKRDGQTFKVNIEPVRAEDGSKKIGVWIRENMLGIGTLTFYDPVTGIYGALGHGINEKNSGRLLSIEGGDLLHSNIDGVKKGEAGTPGELQGSYEPDSKIGSVIFNTNSGIFGKLHLDPERKTLPVADESEVKLDDAKILTCIDGNETREYKIRICAIYHGGESGNRDMLIEVTDPALIESTGGIVQGMSGSPIIQNGKIIGAVTHVLVNNPRKGYGILIKNMMDAYDNGGEPTCGINYMAA